MRWDPRNLYRKVFQDSDEMELFLAEVCSMHWHAQHDAGTPMDETIPLLQAEHPDYAAEIAVYKSRFGEMLGGEIAGTCALVDRLAARRVRLGILTNMPPDQVLTCFDGFSRLGSFDAVTISGFEKAAKPAPQAYEIACRALDVRPADTFFVDDNPDNVSAARALGMTAHLFVTPEGLENALVEAGLLS